MTHHHHKNEIRCGWGWNGLRRLLPESDAIIIIDVLSFTTCVDVATARGATVFPHRLDDVSGARLARSVGAQLAGHRGEDEARFSLSPGSLLRVDAGLRLVLPSPNGSSLSLETGDVPTFAGCLRNAATVAHTARAYGRRISVIAAGERWPDGSLRPCLEDWLGAGALIERLGGRLAPTAAAARAAFRDSGRRLDEILCRTQSGEELIELGYRRDVQIAAELDTSVAAPRLLPRRRDGGDPDHRDGGEGRPAGNGTSTDHAAPRAYVDVAVPPSQT